MGSKRWGSRAGRHAEERRGEVGREQQGTGEGGERKEVREKEQRGRGAETGRRARAGEVTKGGNIIPQRGLPHLASLFSLE